MRRQRLAVSARTCETIHKMRVRRVAPDPARPGQPVRRTAQLLQARSRLPLADPCSSPNRSSATARSGSRWRGVAASRATTSTPSRSTPTGPSWSACATSTPTRSARAVERTGAPGFRSLDAMLAGTDADIVILATPSGLHAEQAVQVAAAGRHVMTEKPMATRWQDGKRMVHACDHGRGPPLRGQAEPAERHPAAGEAGGRQAALRPDLHGEHQRVLDPAAVVLRQRAVARHLGVRRRRLHEPGEPLRGPARLADRPGGERAGLHRDPGPQHPGGGHRRREHPLAHRRARLA